jgi:tRNA pseudouridine-54 N-methylase
MLFENIHTANKMMKFALSKVNGATDHLGSTLSLFCGALKCNIHNIISMEPVSLKSSNCISHIINYIQHKRGKHKKFSHAYNNFSQQLARAFFSATNVYYISDKCLTGDHLIPA